MKLGAGLVIGIFTVALVAAGGGYWLGRVQTNALVDYDRIFWIRAHHGMFQKGVKLGGGEIREFR